MLSRLMDFHLPTAALKKFQDNKQNNYKKLILLILIEVAVNGKNPCLKKTHHKAG